MTAVLSMRADFDPDYGSIADVLVRAIPGMTHRWASILAQQLRISNAGKCFQSYAEIGSWSNCSDEATRRVIKRMEQRGYYRDCRQRRRRSGATSTVLRWIDQTIIAVYKIWKERKSRGPRTPRSGAKIPAFLRLRSPRRMRPPGRRVRGR